MSANGNGNAAKKLSVVHIPGIGPRIPASSILALLGQSGDSIDGQVLLTIKNTCRTLNIGRSTVYRLIERRSEAA
ncbi:MAG TPA: hypothetical protein VHY35_07305 [Stellaceae bacterium]|jgi:hypothetical protein|nr:hypothetical protein [Stellaceae bacterium]